MGGRELSHISWKEVEAVAGPHLTLQWDGREWHLVSTLVKIGKLKVAADV